MAKVKFRLAAFREIRQEPNIGGVDDRTRRVALAAGDGFDWEVSEGKTRRRGAVWTVNAQGRRRAASGDLVRALDAGR